MSCRLKAFAWHFSGSATVLLIVLGTLYLGWYRWPGWYLTGVLHIVPIMVGVDVALGPLITLLIANPSKPARVLARDVSIIVAVQLVALVYGSITLWHGRPLYYAFSVNELSVIQAQDIDPAELVRGRQQNPNFAPHWYSLPRWIWAPLPDDEKTRSTIVAAAIQGGNDVTAMPRYYKDWAAGLPELRKQLVRVGDSRFFSIPQRKLLQQRMQQKGFAPQGRITLAMTGRDVPLLAVFDPGTLKIKDLLLAKP